MSVYKQMPLDKLIVDDRYQRPLDEKRVEKIANGFDPRLLGVLEVSVRNGKCAVFDGQHRLAALRTIKRTKAPCIVHSDLTPEEEAMLFVRHQRERRGIKSVDRFRARFFAGDMTAVEINKAVEAAGFSVRHSSRQGDVRAIQAVTSLERVYKRGNLPETLATLEDLWGGDEKSTDGGLIEGLSVLLEGYGHRFDGDVRDRLRETPPLVILRRAIGHSGGGSAKGTMVAAEIRKVAGLRGAAKKSRTAE